MKKPNASYIAGFFDGEGCIWIVPGKRGTGPGRVYLRMDQKYPSVLMKIKASLSYGRIHRSTRSGQYHLQVLQQDEISNFIRLILPYSIVKLPQLLLAIEFMKVKTTLTKRQKYRFLKKMQRLKRIPH